MIDIFVVAYVGFSFFSSQSKTKSVWWAYCLVFLSRVMKQFRGYKHIIQHLLQSVKPRGSVVVDKYVS
jgi:hypothetical protein